MSLYGPKKQEVIGKFRTHATDTGSAEVQVALLSTRINELSKHFDAHKKDHSSRRGLIIMVGQRRRLLTYLKRSNKDSYLKLIGELGIRK